MGVSKDREKICNMCGESVKVFIISDNVPLCKDCIPITEIKKEKKLIQSESLITEKILEGQKV